MTKIGFRALVLVMMLVLAAGCGPAPAPVTPATPAIEEPTATPCPAVTPTPAPALSAEEKAMIEKLDQEGRQLFEGARQDLARQLAVSEGEIRVVSAESVQWSDTSLGCPEPGMMYAQVITPGYKFVLEHEGKQYDYHAGQGRVILCEE